jgi:hypothetical protein
VVVTPLLLTCVVVGGEDLLDSLPGARTDERLVSAFVVDSHVGNDALVVRMSQNCVKARDVEGRDRFAAGRRNVEPAALQLFAELFQPPLAGRVLFECPGDKQAADRINIDRT